MSLVLLGILNSQVSAVGVNYFLSATRYVGNNQNIYNFNGKASKHRPAMTGDASVAANDAGLYIQYSSDGTSIAVQKSIQSASGDIRVTGQYITSQADYDYMLIMDEYTGNKDLVTVQIDPSDGSINWQNYIGRGTGGSNNVQARDIDANDTYIATIGYDEIGASGVIGLYNSSGTLQWQKAITGAGTYVDNRSVALDSSDNSIIVARDAGTGKVKLVSLDSSGSVNWQQGYWLGSSVYEYAVATVDSSGNVYVSLYDINTTQDASVMKINGSTGAIIWSRKIAVSGDNGTIGGLAVTNDDQIIVIQNAFIGSQKYMLSFATDGTVNWIRRFDKENNGTPEPLSMYAQAAANGAIYLSLATNQIDDAYYRPAFMSLPSDGNFTGTHSAYTNDDYIISTTSDITVSDDTASWSTTTPGLTVSTGSLNTGTANLAVTDYALTTSAVTI